MQPYQERVVREEEALSGKIARLSSFTESEIAEGLEWQDRDLLQQQLKAMREYQAILIRRIDRFI